MQLDHRPNRTPLVPPGGLDPHARDMTATFSTDVTLAEAQTRLAELNQWLPIDGDPTWTLGRLVATNSTGPLRLGYGAWRDLLLGCQFENGRGELITAGGRTVKNVAGYDLTKFMVGQAGVFGRLVTLTSRTYLRPVAAAVAQFAPDDRVINRLMPSPCRPQWAVLTADALWCGYLGDRRTIDYYAAALPAYGPTEVRERPVEDDVRHRAELWQAAGADGSYRAALPPTSLNAFASAAELRDWSADAAFGVAVGFADAARRDAIRAAARAHGGTIGFVDGDQTAFEYEPALHDLLTRLKIAFDPDGQLEPLDPRTPARA